MAVYHMVLLLFPGDGAGCPARVLPVSCLLPGQGQALYVPCDRMSLAHICHGTR